MLVPEGRQLLTVIIVDDDRDHIALLSRTVERAFERDARQVTAICYHDPEVALAELPTRGEVVVLLDYRMGETTGLDWLGDFVREDAGPVVMLTSSGDEHVAAEAFRHGAADYVVKNSFLDGSVSVTSALNEAMRRFRIERTNRDLRRRLKSANLELASKNERLAELTETAHRFVDDVAHEFRTPLAVIKEFASIISDGLGGPVTDDQQHYLGFISNASRDLADLVDDFLDSGKLQARTLRVSRRSHDLRGLVAEAMPMLQSRAKARDVTLEVDVPEDIGAVYVDAEKVRRVLINLVVNALKFSTAGQTVTIVAEPRTSEAVDGLDEVVIGVRDHGPGLPPEELEHLFERFRQGVGAGRLATRGFGLGLNIVQGLVDVNLGTIEVESELGEGSTFSITVPRDDPAAVLAGYLRNVGRRSTSARLTLYRIRRPGSEDAAALAAFVAGVSHAGDLQVPATDGPFLHVLIESEQPRGWRERILAADREVRSDPRHTDLAPLNIEECGSWPLREARAPLRDALGLDVEVRHDA